MLRHMILGCQVDGLQRSLARRRGVQESASCGSGRSCMQSCRGSGSRMKRAGCSSKVWRSHVSTRSKRGKRWCRGGRLGAGSGVVHQGDIWVR